MKELNFNVKFNISYDYVVFNGENVQDVINFVKRYHINGEDEDFFSVRPYDIPNLDFGDLVKWWESTGVIKEDEDYRGRTYNTHNTNNVPMWRKDELLHIITKSERYGYVNNQFMKKGDCIIVVENKFYFSNMDHVKDFDDEIRNHILNMIPFNVLLV